MNKTKIIATLNPSKLNHNLVDEMLLAGVNVVRIDFSPEEAELQIAMAEQVRSCAQQLDKHIGILVDLPGPKVQISDFCNGSVTLQQGAIFNIDGNLDAKSGNQDSVGLDYLPLFEEIELGSILLLDYGRIQLQVFLLDRVNQLAKTKVLAGGPLYGHQAIGILGKEIPLPALSDIDRQGIKLAATINAEFVALSLPFNQGSIEHVRHVINSYGYETQLIAKVDKIQFSTRPQELDDTLQTADMVMIGSSDLACEVMDAKSLSVDNSLYSRIRDFSKPVITATPMMTSMEASPLPSRTEALDLANAIIAGTDAVVLSKSVASGPYVLDAIKSMTRIIGSVESVIESFNSPKEPIQQQDFSCNKSFAISSVLSISQTQRQTGIAVITHNGKAPVLMSRYHSHVPIWALSDDKRLLASLSILRGVEPVYAVTDAQDSTESVMSAIKPAIVNHHNKALIISRFESFEGAGDINISRMVTISPQQHTVQ